MADETTREAAVAELEAAPTPNGDATRAKEAAETPAPTPRATHEDVGSGYTKEAVEKIVQARLQADREDAAKKAAKEQKAAVEKALKDQGEYAKLADARLAEVEEAQRRIAELEPVVTERDSYKEALEAHLAAQRKGLPKHILQLLDLSNPVEQLRWLADNADAVKAPAPEPKPNGSTPSRRSGTTAIGDATTQLPTPPFSLVRGF